MPSPLTIRGTAQVLWRPGYTLSLSSPDGNSLLANGAGHPLRATLTRTSNGAVVPNRKIRLTTNPTGRLGDRVIAWTDANGVARFQIADVHNETVVYTGTLLSSGGASVTDSETVVWGGSTSCDHTCNFGATGGVSFNDDDETPNWASWEVTYDVRCYQSDGSFEVIRKVIVGHTLYFTGASEPTGILTEADVVGNATDTVNYSFQTTGVGQEVVDVIADIVNNPTTSEYYLAYQGALATALAGACS